MRGFHQGQPVLAAGKSLNEAKRAMIMIHGRGAGSQSILQLADALNRPDWAYFAPQAANLAWYPNRFIAPIASNEPYLSSALQVVDDLVNHIVSEGITAENIVLIGFSQGACLVLEYAARHPRRYGGVVGLSGGLIGPEGKTFSYEGSLDGTPVFLGCSDVDFHIPLTRVKESTAALANLGAVVDERIYPGMDHTINDDEISVVQALMDGVI